MMVLVPFTSDEAIKHVIQGDAWHVLSKESSVAAIVKIANEE